MNAAQRSILSMFIPVTFVTMALVFVTGAIAQESATSAAAAARAKLPFAKGTLDSIDLFRHQLKLKTGDGLRTFSYTANTYIFRGKEKITPDGLKVGETIALRFYTDADGQVLVRRIKAYGTTQSVRTEPPVAAESAK